MFELGSIDEIYGENSDQILDPGCFIAIIKRKEMMQFDSLFMIKVAESKGLFGEPDKERNPAKQKVDAPPPARQTSQTCRKIVKRAKVRIANHLNRLKLTRFLDRNAQRYRYMYIIIDRAKSLAL